MQTPSGALTTLVSRSTLGLRQRTHSLRRYATANEAEARKVTSRVESEAGPSSFGQRCVPDSTAENHRDPPAQPLAPASEALQRRISNHTRELQDQLAAVRAKVGKRVNELGAQAGEEFGKLGGRINEVTGYREVENLKTQVVQREKEMTRLREAARRAKEAYDNAVNARSNSQREVTSLLERKHTWTDADVSNFTSLVRTDHASNLAVTQSKLALVEAELAVEQAFDALMKSILERYHEEQVWSDKIRSVSTYGSLAVLVVNLIVFLGAIAVVEPWKRKRLVLGLEERVAGMMKQVEEKIEKEVSVVGSAMVALQSRLDEELPTFQGVPSEQPADVVQDHGQTTHGTPNTSISSALTRLTTCIYASIPYLDEIGPSDQADRDVTVAGLAGVLGGGLITGLAMLAMTRK